MSTGDDPRDDLLVLVDDEGVVVVQREPTGINAVTFTGPGAAPGIVTGHLLEASTMPTAEGLVDSPAVEVSEADLDAGIAALSINDLPAAEAALGQAYPLLVAAGTPFHLEIVRSEADHVVGTELRLRDAADLGWVEIAPAPLEGRFEVRGLTDETVRHEIDSALGA